MVVGGVVALVVAAAGAASADSPALKRGVIVPIGVPQFDPTGAGDGSGFVDAYLPDGGGQVLSRGKFSGLAPRHVPGARFGAAVAAGDLNGDERPEVVVGAPGLARGSDFPGQVYLLRGSPTGITSAGALTLPSPAVAGDLFGSALALRPRDDRSGVSDLFVGAPGTDVTRRGVVKADAGAVYWYTVKDGTPTLVMRITGDSPNVGGHADPGDRFGEVLAPAHAGVAVGLPHEDVFDAEDAGAMIRLRVDLETAKLLPSPIWSQHTVSFNGLAEAGDRFGAAVSAEGYVVGVPGEDIGKLRDAGVVHTFERSSTLPNALARGRQLSQNSHDVPGTAEGGDRFGSAVSRGTFVCFEQDMVAIGAPGEDVGAIRDAGSVTLVPAHPGTVERPCRARVLTQGGGLPGTPEQGDALGGALSVLPGDPVLESAQMDQLIAGAPGEDGGSGIAITLFRGRTNSVGAQTGPLAGARYGSVLPAEVGWMTPKDQ